MNGHSKALGALLSDPSISVILVEHRDRLMRFGADYVEAALAASGRKLLGVDDTEVNDDLVHDITDVMTSFCAGLYGRRLSGRKALAGVAAMERQE